MRVWKFSYWSSTRAACLSKTASGGNIYLGPRERKERGSKRKDAGLKNVEKEYSLDREEHSGEVNRDGHPWTGSN